MPPSQTALDFCAAVRSCIGASTASERTRLRLAMVHMCHTMDADTAKTLLNSLTCVYLNDESLEQTDHSEQSEHPDQSEQSELDWGVRHDRHALQTLRAIFEVGDVVDHLHTATLVHDPSERLRLRAQLEEDLASRAHAHRQRTHEEQAQRVRHREVLTMCEVAYDIVSKRQWSKHAKIKQRFKQNREGKRRRGKGQDPPPTSRPPDALHACLDLVVATDAVLMRHAPVFWSTLQIEHERVDSFTRLALLHRLRVYLERHGRASLPESMHKTMDDVLQRLGPADADVVRTANDEKAIASKRKLARVRVVRALRRVLHAIVEPPRAISAISAISASSATSFVSSSASRRARIIHVKDT